MRILINNAVMDTDSSSSAPDEEFRFTSCVRGFHVYESAWAPVYHEILHCSREEGNVHDPYAVKVMKSGRVVGHLPKKISATCSLFLRKGGTISCQVTDERRKRSYDLVQGGLEIQCLLIFSSKKRDLLDKVQKLLALSIEKVEKSVKNEMAKDLAKDKMAMVNEIATDKETADDACVILPAAKKVKVEADCVIKPVEVVEDDATSQPWAAFPTTRIRLYAEEKAILVSDRKLNDKHINFAQALLKAQHPRIEGLRNTLQQARFNFSISDKVVQIVHVRMDHWIVISNIFTSTKGQVDVYDTSYGEIDKSSRILIYSMFDEPVQINLIQGMQKQVGGVDCGVFSIAIATSLVHGQNPVSVVYNQPSLRAHLVSCFEKLAMIPFI